MTSLTPSRLALARTHFAIRQPTVESEIMASTARPEPCSPPSPRRTPPKAETCGKRAHSARCTLIASEVSPLSMALPLLQAALEIAPPAADRSGFFFARYFFLTQRPLPSRPISRH